MATQQYYFAQTVLQQTLFDKTSGELLSAGIVRYYSDPDFSTSKDVYEVSYAAEAGYSYTNIGSELTLSSIGTFVDDDGQNFIPILFPWDGDADDPGEFEPYYVAVYNSEEVLQFSLAGIPYNEYSSSTTVGDTEETDNILTNPQFSNVLFPGSSAAITIAGTDEVTEIAPGWYIKASGSGTVTLSQLSLTIDTPGYAAYALQIVSTSGITDLNLYQRITNSPRLLSLATVQGYVEAACSTSSSIDMTMYYQYSTDDDPTEIFTSATTADTEYAALTGSTIITETPSTANATGYLDIILNIGTNSTVQVTNFQFISILSESSLSGYIQTSTPVQQSQLFYYYQPQLQFKPIESYTLGWNFPFNPGQMLGQSGAVVSGTNVANYIMDQTILFQSVASSFSWANSSYTGLTLTCAVAGQCAIMQYLGAREAYSLLQNRMAMMISGSSSVSITGTISLYWADSTVTALPHVTSTFFSSLTSGVPTTLDSGWTLVPSQFPQKFTFGTSTTVTNLNLWDATDVDGIDEATFFAVVIGFPAAAVSQTITINYATLCSGDIATVPSPTTQEDYLRSLQCYYESSYSYNVVPGTSSQTVNSIVKQMDTVTNFDPDMYLLVTSFSIQYFQTKRTIPTVSIYSPDTGSVNTVYGQVYSGGALLTAAAVAFSYWTAANSGTKSISYNPSGTGVTVYPGIGLAFSVTGQSFPYSTQCLITLHYVSDARLGVVD